MEEFTSLKDVVAIRFQPDPEGPPEGVYCLECMNAAEDWEWANLDPGGHYYFAYQREVESANCAQCGRLIG